MNKQKEALQQAYQRWTQGIYQAAYEQYEDLLRTAPNDAEILREYARAKFSEYDDLEQAAQLFERAIVADPNGSISALLCLGELYACGYGKGYKAALGVYQRVIELDPHNVDAYIGIGMLSTPSSSYVSFKERIEAFRMVTQIAPQRADGHRNLGMALAENGEAEDREEARKEFGIAEKLLVQSGKYKLAQSTKRYCQQLEANHTIRGYSYGKTEPMVWDF
jgi:tetratricopeptide (TPR) repeat protein